jgi:hypothetical protein
VQHAEGTTTKGGRLGFFQQLELLLLLMTLEWTRIAKHQSLSWVSQAILVNSKVGRTCFVHSKGTATGRHQEQTTLVRQTFIKIKQENRGYMEKENKNAHFITPAKRILKASGFRLFGNTNNDPRLRFPPLRSAAALRL